MADAKISQLPVATTPLAGTELVPLVQGGVTVQSTVDKVLTGTVPSGTANGVLFLNGSKAVTSGSALTFDGTSFNVSGADGSTIARWINTTGRLRLRPYADATLGAIFESTNAAESAYAPFSLYGSSVRINGDTVVIGLIGGSEEMRLTSTGLGIGTSSPAVKLEVSGSVTVTADSSATMTIGRYGAGYTWSLIRPSTTSTGLELRDFSGNALYQLDQSSGANKHIWYTAANERMRLDSSGNLGLGVTPSAWFSDRKAMQLGSGASVNGSAATSSFVEFGANFYQNASSSDVYIASSTASKYRQLSGVHSWYTAPSGTAGDAISFTQAMTLTSGGDLLLGATSTSVFEKFVLNGRAYLTDQSAPGTPTGGGVLYVEGGALKYKGSSGTVTTIANA